MNEEEIIEHLNSYLAYKLMEIYKDVRLPEGEEYIFSKFDENDYISKDKVREKIEELEKFIESKRILPVDIIEDQNRNVKWKIEALQELLEGDDK